MDKNKDKINKKLGIEGEIDTKEEALAVVDGQMGIDEYLENVTDGEDVKEKVEAKKIAKQKILQTAGIGKNVIQKSVDVVMHESMMPYSEHVILDRALPRVEDGLKPVQRRILFTLSELAITPDKPYKKSARIVGECLGKYHPHGDSSVYDAMVRMAQPFNMREILVDGHGNFGSVDGDSAAAMRYTEARMAPLALELLRDLEKDTVEWNFNFDDSLQEPATLPARFPNLLVNGASGIAVGLATNIPPHNLNETINGCIAYIDNPKIKLAEMMKIIKGPDFPTGGYIVASDELNKAYETGKGKILIRAKLHVENADYDKKNIVITELPYQVNKATLLSKILDLRESKKDALAGISEICDESDRNGMRAVVRIKKDVDPNYIIEMLYKHSDLQVSYGINMVAVAGGKPQKLGLLDIIAYYTDYQRDIVLRRSKFDLAAAKERAHVVEGLVIAVQNIDEVIKIIKKSANPAEAKVALVARFKLSAVQAQAILDMRLARLTSLEVLRLEQELAELKKKIAELTEIIASKKIQLDIVKSELNDIKKRFKTPRLTQILKSVDEYIVPDEQISLIAEKIVVGVTRAKTIKSMTLKHCQAASTDFSEKTNDFDCFTYLLGTASNKMLIAFSNFGNAFKIDAGTIPDCKWRERGILFSTFENEAKVGEVPVAIFEMPEKLEGELLFFTKFGMIRRVEWGEFNLQKGYYQAIKLKDGDEVIFAEVNKEGGTIVFVTENGLCLNAVKDDIPVQGRISGGVKGVNIAEGDKLLFVSCASETDKLALVSDKCFAKRVAVSEIDKMARYRKGVKCFNLVKENGTKLIFAGNCLDKEDFDIILTDTMGVPSAYSTSVFEVQPRNSKGKSLVKSKKGLDLVSAIKYLNKFN